METKTTHTHHWYACVCVFFSGTKHSNVHKQTQSERESEPSANPIDVVVRCHRTAAVN